METQLPPCNNAHANAVMKILQWMHPHTKISYNEQTNANPKFQYNTIFICHSRKTHFGCLLQQTKHCSVLLCFNSFKYNCLFVDFSCKFRNFRSFRPVYTFVQFSGNFHTYVNEIILPKRNSLQTPKQIIVLLYTVVRFANITFCICITPFWF